MVRFCPERTLGPRRPSYAIGLPLSGPRVSAASPRQSLATRASDTSSYRPEADGI